MSKAFLDTNILTYATDAGTPGKQTVARELMRRLSVDSLPCISTQVHQEFYVVATRKLGIEPLQAKGILQTFRHMETAVVEPDDVSRAIDGSILWQLSFWDALIVVAARKLNCTVLYTEDLNDGQVIDGVQVANPFSPEPT
jgi:predicted nucleic acid-binding protein